jgi:surface protein
MFSDIKTDLTHWDVSHASDAQKAFFNATTFNQNIGSWDVSQVTNMSHMFLSATAFNQNIGIPKHPYHRRHLANIPITNILVKGTCARKHIRHPPDNI